MTKISLITATLNCADTIEETIKSVFAQTYSDIEHIIVDGGSTDATLSKIEPWLQRCGDKIKYIEKSDKGVYEAINNGIKVATGDVVGVLHSDDFFTSADILESVARTFSDSSIDMVYDDVHFVNTDSPERVLRYYSGAWFDRKKLRYGIAPPHPSMYCRREVYLKYGLYSTDYKIAGDFDMFVRLLWKWEITARYLPVDMVTMRTGGISTRWSSRLWRNTAEKHRVLLDNGIKTSWWQVLYRYVLLLCHYSWHRGRK